MVLGTRQESEDAKDDTNAKTEEGLEYYGRGRSIDFLPNLGVPYI